MYYSGGKKKDSIACIVAILVSIAMRLLNGILVTYGKIECCIRVKIRKNKKVERL